MNTTHTPGPWAIIGKSHIVSKGHIMNARHHRQHAEQMACAAKFRKLFMAACPSDTWFRHHMREIHLACIRQAKLARGVWAFPR